MNKKEHDIFYAIRRNPSLDYALLLVCFLINNSNSIT